ncbi:MAG: glycosyltransferase family 2 protein [Vicinamibacterales bacterium]
MEERGAGPLPTNSSSFRLLETDAVAPRPGTSIVAACMNREYNLLRVLPSWRALPVDEIVIVDWSSDTPLWPTLRDIGDPRLRCIRIDGEARWSASLALNVGIRMATHALIVKLDCDVSATPDFLARNPVARGEFVRGFWKSAVDAGEPDQVHTHGNIIAFKEDYLAVGGYDERIVTYGWEDSDMYLRLTLDRGLAARVMDLSSLRHLEQPAGSRVLFQAVDRQKYLGLYESTELEGATNKYEAFMSGSWTAGFAAHDYACLRESEQLVTGRRLTTNRTSATGVRSIAGALAAAELLRWSDTLSFLPDAVRRHVDLGHLLADAHRRSRGEQLVKALTAREGVHFVSATEPAVQAAIVQTLVRVAQDRPDVDGPFLLVSEGSWGEADLSGTQVFEVPADLLEALATACARDTAAGLAGLDRASRETGASCHVRVDSATLVDEAIARAAWLAQTQSPRYTTPSAPLRRSALVSSLFDERNLFRFVEYVACLVLNLQVFERLVICYESSNGLLLSAIERLTATSNMALGRVLFVPYGARPTFQQLFDLQSVLPDDVLLAVANADVAFDASLSKLSGMDLTDTVAVLSRWEVAKPGESPSLIRYPNGTPNVLSADAWIARTPFIPDFRLDFEIGTLQCDSFINNQLGKSGRYRAINPCLDVCIFHVHDERFNTSAQKQARNQQDMEARYEAERLRNGGEDPVRGLAWCVAATTLRRTKLTTWRPYGVVLNLSSAADFGSLVLLEILRRDLRAMPDVMLVLALREPDLHGTVGRLFERYLAFVDADNAILDIAETRPFTPASGGPVARRVEVAALASAAAEPDADTRARLLRDTLFGGTATPDCTRAEVVATFDTDAHMALLQALAQGRTEVFQTIQAFVDTLEPWAAERRMLTPYLFDLRTVEAQRARAAAAPGTPRVTFVTSLFRGGEFLPGYLENVVAAAHAAGGEVILIDANRDDRDGPVVRAFLASHPYAARVLDYVQLEQDPGLYNCWRLAIERARAPIITNANLDDRRGPWHTAHLVDVLEANPEFMLASGSIACVRTDGPAGWFRLVDTEVWFHGEGSRPIGLQDLYIEDEHGEIRSRCVPHCMPVWRKELHARHGYFDEERYGTSADWAFWLKCARAGERLYFDERPFGRYFMNAESHNRRNDIDGQKELRIIEDMLGRRQQKVTKQ